MNLVIQEPKDEERTIALPLGVRKSVLNGSPSGAGLKDGAMLAFRFRGQGEDDNVEEGDNHDWDVIMPRYDEEEEEEEEEEAGERPGGDDDDDDRDDI